ncbi:2'-5' RNA ligase family protein [Branchiibius sp. NY16-3462-2]|uniref:2'-5' RNA ligase family protein n=1 Tax=Branchiibius sp. NY16-3462-2 TaxID=1807500 RepID=UPI000792CC0A|nr:2'-5' RNA ligase family protein [Branchiibius sp. NY16-3462-2]KYH43590.1 hypothetical protein AZH51_03800 [Branchiibius sp. NY16-3462-2]
MQSLDAVLIAADDARVRDLWSRLQDAGLPSRGDHRSSSNRPHLTLTSAPAFSPACITYAESLADRLPMTLPVAGLRFFDTSNITHLLLTGGDWLDNKVQELRERAGDPHRDRPWTPHITLSGRLSPTQVTRARDVLIDVPGEVTLAAITHWDPQTRRVRPI